MSRPSSPSNFANRRNCGKLLRFYSFLRLLSLPLSEVTEHLERFQLYLERAFDFWTALLRAWFLGLPWVTELNHLQSHRSIGATKIEVHTPARLF